MSLVNPADTLERQNAKLLQIAQSLMRRVEQKSEQSGLAYAQFERAALLETEVRDRTRDLERALDLLQESNTRLEDANLETERARSNLTQAIETINEGFALFERDAGLILSNSRFCRDLTDITARLVDGLSFEDYVSLISNSEFLSLPDGQTPADWAARRMRRHRDDHVVFNVQLRFDRWLQVSEHRTSSGGTVILQTDVTAIIRRERHARDKIRDKQAGILQATLDHLNQGVCIFDRNLSLVGWNAGMSQLFSSAPDSGVMGMAFDTLVGRLNEELTFDPSFSADRFRAWSEGDTRRPVLFEMHRGLAQTYSVFAQEMPDGGLVISFTDVTAERAAARTLFEMNELLERRVEDRTKELGEALAEAERANASKTRFMTAASHDLLQPLSAAKLFVSSIRDQTDRADAAKITRKAEMALSSVEHFIAALLDISKLDAGRAVFDVAPVRLSRIFEPLRNELEPLARQKGLDLTILDCSLTVRSDPGYLRRIVQNLVSNAIRYTDQGRVLVGVRRTGNVARIEVWDTGRGIALADQVTIFKEFERLSPDNADTGLGLGLSIVERACKGLDHPLSLWSEPGVGSCFSLNVPVIEGATLDAPPLEPPHTTDLGDQLILLVEDNPPLAEALTAMIEGFGCTVIHALDAAQALELLAEIELVPDAMLIDYQLGAGADGVQLLRALRSLYGAVPAAIVSAERSRVLRDACKGLDVALVQKPVQGERLRALLGDLFNPV